MNGKILKNDLNLIYYWYKRSSIIDKVNSHIKCEDLQLKRHIYNIR